MGLLHKKRVLMMQTHFMGNNLESPLVGKNLSKNRAEDSALFEDIGLDTAVTFSSMNKLNKDMLENCCITFPDTHLLLLPGTETKCRETFDRDIGKAVSRVIHDADQCAEIVLIDCNSGDDKLSSKLMSMADLIVINLTQHRYVLDKFFIEYNRYFADNQKIFYLFGDYDDNSCFNINNFRRRYKKFINSNNSGVIPYCTAFLDAQNESDVVRFIKDGLEIEKSGKIETILNYCRKALLTGQYNREETEYFFHRSRLSVEKMLDMLHVPVRKNRREGGMP
jgi:cellulose biosynthesis protein BcsQ